MKRRVKLPLPIFRQNRALEPIGRRITLRKGTKGRKARKTGKKAPKWNKSRLAEADAIFSKEIIARDSHCMFPGCVRETQLTCSHYFGRATKSTRFYKDNALTLCRTHHFWDKQLGWEYQKQRKEIHGWDGQYTLFQRRWLGPKRWLALLERSKIQMKPKEIKEMVYKILL